MVASAHAATDPAAAAAARARQQAVAAAEQQRLAQEAQERAAAEAEERRAAEATAAEANRARILEQYYAGSSSESESDEGLVAAGGKGPQDWELWGDPREVHRWPLAPCAASCAGAAAILQARVRGCIQRRAQPMLRILQSTQENVLQESALCLLSAD